MRLTLGDIADLCDGTLERGAPDRLLEDVATDTRKPIPDGALFVALRGDHFDGHDFVREAFEQGASAAMVDRGDWSDVSGGIVRVDETLEGLQSLAAGWRERFDMPIVGVTGSNGKTIVKEMLSGIFAREGTVYRSPASYNSQVGVPLSLLGLSREHEIAVIEAGISRVGEMERLERMIQPDAGAITNIGLAHAAGLKTLETTAREKLKLFSGFDDEPLIHPTESEPLREHSLPGRPVGFSAEKKEKKTGEARASYALVGLERREDGFDCAVRGPGGEVHRLSLHVPGEHNVQNALCAAATAREMGASWEAIRAGLASFELAPMRLEMHTMPSGVTLLNDAYSSDPVSARAALSALDQYASEGRRIAILGDMLDLGERAEEAHRKLGVVCANLELDALICFGERARWIGESAREHGMAPEEVDFFEEMDRLVESLDARLQSGDAVLFKASRQLELDRAAERLLESVAPTRLYIDLDRIRSNYHALGEQLGGDAGFMAVVKSFGYGNDSTRIAQTLVREGVDALAVAYPDEAIPLRERGLHLPILVTNVLPEEADKIAEYDLTAQVYTRKVVRRLSREAERHGCEVSAHLKVETGMNRVGLPPEDVVEFARWIDREVDGVTYRGAMTHFAAADVPEEDAFTRGQIETFQRVLDDLEVADLAPEVVHAANTAAAWRFPETHFDMVRIGLGLYGLAPSGAVYETGEMEPALRLTTRVVHVKSVEPGDTVGYGRTWRADEPARIATIAAGYNDGLPRFMSNGGEVLIGGERCPIVGSVCMDVSMVDVTDVPSVEVGDEVVLFGRQEDARIAVDEIAERGDTINYEILCNISPRVRRIFVRESD